MARWPNESDIDYRDTMDLQRYRADIESGQIATYHEYGPSKNKIYFNKSDMTEMKMFGSPSLTLMGFKPLNRLKPYYQTKPSCFVYPDEQRCNGSILAFNALIIAMDKLQQFAVCRYIFRKTSGPRFVALIAQKEVKNEQNVQIVPPGMNMIYLPFADDIRKIDVDGQDEYKRCDEKEDEELIEKSKGIIDKLLLPEPPEPTNPALQRHYDALEALALEQGNNDNDDEREDMEFVDEIKPADDQMIDAAKDEIDAFLQCLENKCGALEVVEATKTTRKRKADQTKPKAAKKRKIDVSAPGLDWKQLAENDELKSLKVKDLKVYLNQNGLKMSGKKAELIERIKGHLGL